MKKAIYTILLFTGFVSSLLLSGCRDDFSKLDLEKIAGVTIDTTGQSSLSVFQFDRLIVDPVLQTSIPEEDLEFEWKINLQPNGLDYTVMSTERKLNFEVSLIPTSVNRLHQVTLTVTDKKTSLQYIMAWPLTIRNSIGEGLVIAETPDGINTDISHIMSPLVTSNYSGESIKRRVFSTVNGYTLPGLTTELLYTMRGRDPVLLGITNNSFYSVKTLDYTYFGGLEDFFYSTPNVIKPQFIGGFRLGTVEMGVIVNNGSLHSATLSTGIFGLPADFPYFAPSRIALNPEGVIDVHFYDEINGKFIYLPSITAFGDRNMHVMASATTPFNPANLPNKTVLASINNQNDQFLHLLKDKTSSQIGLYISTGGGYVDPNIISPAPVALISLAGAPDINNAKHFVLLDNQQVLYYATETKIYAAIYGAAVPRFEERYTVPNGEKITTLQVFQQPDYPVRDLAVSPPYLATNNRQLIMSTYGTEGKVYLLPMINVGEGDIDVSKIKTFGGFDRIIAIAPQL